MRIIRHPKRQPQCAFCVYWKGFADPKFYSQQLGFEFEAGVYAQCTAKSCKRASNTAACRDDYEAHVLYK